MGFRYEPKVKPPVTDSEYKDIAAQLEEAQEKSTDHFVLYDLEKNESKPEIKKKLLYVAEKEGTNLKVQSLRKQNSLRLTFPATTSKRTARTTRMSAEEARKQILDALKKSSQPLSRKDILGREDVSVTDASWNLRIKELLKQGKVKRIGSRKDSKYELK